MVFFAKFYRRSDDQSSNFLPKVTDVLKVTFRFVCRNYQDSEYIFPTFFAIACQWSVNLNLFTDHEFVFGFEDNDLHYDTYNNENEIIFLI